MGGKNRENIEGTCHVFDFVVVGRPRHVGQWDIASSAHMLYTAVGLQLGSSNGNGYLRRTN